jgi:hypothetical protein
MKSHQKLAETVLDAYKTHISDLINNYQSEYSLDSLADVSRNLGYHDAKMRDWSSGTTVSFPKYFDLRSRLEGKISPMKEEYTSTLEKNLKDHLASSIDTYRGDTERKNLRLVAKEFGYSPSLVIDIAAARTMASPKTAFGILSKIQNEETVEDILRPIINLPQDDKSDFLQLPIDVMQAFRSYQPVSVEEQVELFSVILNKLGSSVKYFTTVSEKERNVLRRNVPSVPVSMEVLMKARQLVRCEKNYQEWLEMHNSMSGVK